MRNLDWPGFHIGNLIQAMPELDPSPMGGPGTSLTPAQFCQIFLL
jgi:hypothetical protein